MRPPNEKICVGLSLICRSRRSVFYGFHYEFLESVRLDKSLLVFIKDAPAKLCLLLSHVCAFLVGTAVGVPNKRQNLLSGHLVIM